MIRTFSPARPDAPALLRGLAMAACAAGTGVWAALLLAPVPHEFPPALETAEQAAPDTSAVAQWFGGQALRVRVAVSGVIASNDGGGAALLSVDGAAPRAYRVGQALAPGVVLESVSRTSVSVSQDGVIDTVALPVKSLRGQEGIVSVPAPASTPTER
jgi:general secretion pathway protein C